MPFNFLIHIIKIHSLVQKLHFVKVEKFGKKIKNAGINGFFKNTRVVQVVMHNVIYATAIVQITDIV